MKDRPESPEDIATMTTTIYGIKTCDTCRKAQKALADAQLHDIRATPLREEELREFLDTFGEALINKASTTWRGLSEAEKALSPEALITAHPTLMKRPVIRKDGALYLGWKKDVRSSLGVM